MGRAGHVIGDQVVQICDLREYFEWDCMCMAVLSLSLYEWRLSL